MAWHSVAYIAPFVAVIGLLGSGRASGLTAGLVGLVLAAVAACVARLDSGGHGAFLASEAVRGTWLAWQAIAVLAAGLFFHRAVVATQEQAAAPARVDDAGRYRALFRACFLLGIFGESLTGFGVGYLIAFGAARELGLRGVYAVVLPGFSQICVPFGAMAVGTGIGASLAGIPIGLMGSWSAIFLAPMLLGFLAFFWRMCGHAGLIVTRRDQCIDLAYVALFVAMLLAASRLNIVELGGLLAAATVLAVDLVCHDRRLPAPVWRARLASAWPYIAVTGALLASRLVPGARDALTSLGVSHPYPDLPGFAWLYNPSLFLVVGALVVVFVRGRSADLGAIGRDTAKSAWRAIAVTLVFVVFAQWLNASGVAATLAQQALALLGTGAVVASPFIGALGGFLTGSNTGSNSMAMPIQAGLAAGTALPQGFLAGLQNVVGSNFALLAPQRVAMMKGLAEPGITEAMILRTIAPLGAMVLTLAMVMLAVAIGYGGKLS